MTITVDGVDLNDTQKIIITAKLAAETSAPFPLRASAQYTVLASTLGTGEEILGEIYDPSKAAWQAWFFEGQRVKLAQNQETLLFSELSALVRFVKPITAATVGLTVFYT